MVRTPALEKLAARTGLGEVGLCIGLDPDLERLPAHLGVGAEAVVAFNRAIVAATCQLVAAYKPNMAFYEALGAAGWEALRQTMEAIPADVPVILDAKRGDIGNTSRAYARALYEELGADAITVSPYMGRDSLQPFVDYADRLTFVLAATSNPGAAEVQDAPDASGRPVCLRVAAMARELDGRPGAVGLVVGATRTAVFGALRAAAPDQWWLLPGVGAQGGDVRAALAQTGRRALVNVSREVIFASSGRDFDEAAGRAAERIRDAILAVRA